MREHGVSDEGGVGQSISFRDSFRNLTLESRLKSLRVVRDLMKPVRHLGQFFLEPPSFCLVLQLEGSRLGPGAILRVFQRAFQNHTPFAFFVKLTRDGAELFPIPASQRAVERLRLPLLILIGPQARQRGSCGLRGLRE